MKHVGTLALILALSAGTALAKSASDILKVTGIQGGVIVHIGCDDAQFLMDLKANDSYLVQGLDTDLNKVHAARDELVRKGANGVVTATRFNGTHLPYAENIVNLLIAEDLGKVSKDEVMRALAPNGVAYVKEGDAWKKTVKPIPDDIDEWSHYMHDASNNPVAQDDRIHPPKHLQWVGSPRYSRHHDHMSSMNACVTSGGRVFYMMDESNRLSIYLEPTWKLVARDAFNGSLLWKRDIEEWYTHMHRLKSGPAYMPRKLVAVGDLLYATLGVHSPLTAIDAATGETLKTFEPDMECDEILHDDGTIFIVGKAKSDQEDTVDNRAIKGSSERRIVAIRASDGEVLWDHTSRVLPLTMAANEHHLAFHDAEKIVSLDRETGKVRWHSEQLAFWKNMPSNYSPTLVLYKDLVFFTGGVGGKAHRGAQDKMQAIDAKNGKTLWEADHPPSGYQSPEDIMVSAGLVWCGDTTSGKGSGDMKGRDPYTGEVKKSIPPDVETYWFHHRCYKARATENYLLMSRTGIEFVDHKEETWKINHWVRGACLYGIMPANGMIYTPQHPCACYPETKLRGFNALTSQRIPIPSPSDRERLEKGPAYDQIAQLKDDAGPEDWPTFRQNGKRSGSTATKVSANLKTSWKARITGPYSFKSENRISQPVVAAGKVYLTAIDLHTIFALDEATGEEVWRFTAGGRVDSAPTIYKGLALFGCTDGYVYCLRADTGEEAWRFLAAETDQRVVSFEQIESSWPVPGNVLVENDTAYFVAGRSIFLDGGLRVYRINPITGEMISKSVMNDKDPDGKPIQDYIEWLNMPAGLPDIMSSDGERVYMRSTVFDLEAKRTRIDRVAVEDQLGEDAHLFCPSGFLDDSWWHRTYQVFGRSFSGGHSGYSRAGKYTPSGKIMTFDEDNVYVFGRKPQYYKWTTPIEHQLYATAFKDIQAPAKGQSKPAAKKKAAAEAVPGMITFRNTPSLDPTGKPLAFEAWVKRTGDDGAVIARGGPAEGYALFVEKGHAAVALRSDGYEHTIRDTRVLSKGWTHLAGLLTKDNTLQLYVDGERVAEKTQVPFVASDPKQPLHIGGDDQSGVGSSYTPPFLFRGAIDEVRLYTGSVSAEDIVRHAKNVDDLKAADAKLVLHCSLEKGAAKDQSGNKNHGAFANLKTIEGKTGEALQFAGAATKKGKRPPIGKKANQPAFTYRWANPVPLFARAMVKTGDAVIVAGPQDIVDEEKVKGLMASPEMQERLASQADMLAGKKGGLLWMVNPETGEKTAEFVLDAPPIFDGMIAANGKLYISTMAGDVVCLEGK